MGEGDEVAGGAVAKERARPARRAPSRRRKPKARTIVRWSAKREDMFLAALAETANVAASIRASGLSETNVYRRRRGSDEFRARWGAALREGYVKLETLLLDRALNGVEKTVWHGGKAVGTMIEYSDRLALALLAAHRGTVLGPAPQADEVPEEDLRARLAERLSAMNRGMGGAG